MLTRRLLLQAGLGAIGAAGAGLVARSSTSSASVDPRQFGAVGDGVANDAAAVLAAMRLAVERGLPLDGGDTLFGISGDLRIANQQHPWIRSLRLRQLSPSGARKSLHLVDCQAIRIDRLDIDVGGAKAVGYMNESGGLWIDGGSGHRVANVDVSGHGKNSLIAVWNTRDSLYTGLHVHDVSFDDRGARDDVVQGIWLNANTNCILQNAVVADLTGNASFRGRSFPNLRTRGIALGGNRACTVIDALVQNVDQGIDFTGSDGNVGCSVVRGRAFQCTSVGLKFANSAVDCRATGFTAERCGAQGFLISGPSDVLPHSTANIELSDCVALDSGYNHFPTATAGFMIQAGAGAKGPLVFYPRDIRLVRCSAIDRQADKTMDFGFYSNVVAQSGSVPPNRMTACRSSGHRLEARHGSWLVD